MLPQIAPYMVLRAVARRCSSSRRPSSGSYNVIMTLRRGEPLRRRPLEEADAAMKMTPALVVIGGLLVFWSSVFVAVILPAMTMDEQPSDDLARRGRAEEQAGHDLYVAQRLQLLPLAVRARHRLGPGRGAHRRSAATTSASSPAILGTERTGPDLSQEGGEHPDDWHLAHFTNPRYTRPLSLMPSWEFLGTDEIRAADRLRAVAGRPGRGRARGAPAASGSRRPSRPTRPAPDANIAWLHAHVPAVWRPMPNPYPATRGRPGARQEDLPGVLHQLPRPGRRRQGPGRAVPRPAAAELHHAARPTWSRASTSAASSTTRS